MNSTLSLVAIAASIIFLGCPTDPPEPPDGLNPRDFTWVRDSIGDGNATFVPLGLYGSSHTNVYFVNPDGDLWGNKLWRFNGQTWTDISQAFADAYNSKGLLAFPWAPQAIHGFGPNDIWVVGGRDTSLEGSGPYKQGFVLRYLNGTWGVTEIPNSHLLVSIWGSSPSNVLVGEFEGGLYHFNGQNWTNVSNDDSVSKAHIVGVSPNEAYVGGLTLRQGRLFIFLYKWDGQTLTQLEMTEATSGANTFDVSLAWHAGTLVSRAVDRVVRRTGTGTWETMYASSSGQVLFLTTYGSSDLVAVGGSAGELVLHFNGKDWYRIPSLNRTDLYYYRAYQVGDHLFMLGIPRGFNLKAYITRGIPK